jgi:putative ABC transport system substrate-binding protein
VSAMRRRHVIVLGGAGLVGVPVSQAQARRHRIAFLGGIVPDATALSTQVEPLREGLRELGYVEGQNIEIHYRWAEGKPERLAGLASELLSLKPDVIVASAPGPTQTAKAATTTVPIVAVGVDNPVEMGLAAEFARPGGNITGISSFGSELVAKRLQLLKEIAPQTRRVAVLMNPDNVPRSIVEPTMRRFEKTLGLPIQLVEARGPEQFDAAFAAIKSEGADGLLVFADSAFWTHRARLHELVAKHRLPSIWGAGAYLDGGGLASYQSDWPALFRRSASLVDLILKGTKPAVIPFEQATKLELVINLKAAQAMGLTVPSALLVAADKVIR